MLEKYFGCECSCLNHISRFGYFPPKEGEKIDEEENVIYLSVKTENYLNRILPPIISNPLYWLDEFSRYFRFHILRRIPIALSYLFSPYYSRKYGVLDCFDFQDKDLPEIKEFLSHLTEEEETIEKVEDSILWLSNEKWQLKLYIYRLGDDHLFCLGWGIQFLSRTILGRIKYALKYIFGRIRDEQDFKINKEETKVIKGLITAVGKLNETNNS